MNIVSIDITEPLAGEMIPFTNNPTQIKHAQGDRPRTVPSQADNCYLTWIPMVQISSPYHQI